MKAFIVSITGLLMISVSAKADSGKFYGSFHALKGQEQETKEVMSQLFAEAKNMGWKVTEESPTISTIFINYKMKTDEKINDALIKFGACEKSYTDCESLYNWVKVNPPLTTQNYKGSLMIPAKQTTYYFSMDVGSDLQENFLREERKKIVTLSKRLDTFIKKYQYNGTTSEHKGLYHNTGVSEGCSQAGNPSCIITEIKIAQ